ncbi:spermidine synthase [Ancylostoma duodenale]|uniref:Spermidine synthase n=1 Tax=Ancylostoma duodenale TaxID=51022 RepID=A0A0C2GL19_9BILA|nr:spermidine synthase [Ancylostoma duodenale]
MRDKRHVCELSELLDADLVETYGNVLVLDGIIQATERDEFSYQEMLAHLPMFAHPNPKKVLIIGGGDGGILREVLKHPEVEHVTMCEIDRVVIDVSKKFLPGMSCCFSNPKLNLFCGDGFEFLKKHKNEFDVIITDSSDPVGPAESLFGQSYYELLRDSLNENGVLSSQGECPWLDLTLIGKVIHQYCSPIFPVVRYAVGSVPTYTSGLMGYVVCSKSKDIDVTTPSRMLSDDDVKRMKLRFYNSQVHSAAFVLPQFVKEEIEKK